MPALIKSSFPPAGREGKAGSDAASSEPSLRLRAGWEGACPGQPLRPGGGHEGRKGHEASAWELGFVPGTTSPSPIRISWAVTAGHHVSDPQRRGTEPTGTVPGRSATPNPISPSPPRPALPSSAGSCRDLRRELKASPSREHHATLAQHRAASEEVDVEPPSNQP